MDRIIHKKLTGTGVALVTPFTDDDEVDFYALERLLDHVSPQVDYLVVHGTTAETATLTYAEGDRILRFVHKHNAGKLPVVYGIGSNATKEALNVIRNTDFEGVDAVLSISPYYNKPTQPGIIRHYEALADALPVPLIIYNVPSRTASNIEADTTLHLANHPNIIGTKEASGLFDQITKIAIAKPDDFLLISGDDLLTLPIMSLGGDGVISVLANMFPGKHQRLGGRCSNGQQATNASHHEETLSGCTSGF